MESVAKILHVHAQVLVLMARLLGGGEEASTLALHEREEGVLVPFRNQHDAKDQVHATADVVGQQ